MNETKKPPGAGGFFILIRPLYLFSDEGLMVNGRARIKLTFTETKVAFVGYTTNTTFVVFSSCTD